MMDNLFLQILNMSFNGSVIILLVIIIRLFLKKMPKAFSYSLWSVVLFRLICPISFESSLSFIPFNLNPISSDIIYANNPKINTGNSIIDNVINQSLPEATIGNSVNPIQIWIFIGRIVWILGIALLLIYSIISLVKLQKNFVQQFMKMIIYISQKILQHPLLLVLSIPKYTFHAISQILKNPIFCYMNKHISKDMTT